MDVLKILIVEDDLILADRIVDDLVDAGYVITDNVANSDDALRAFRKRIPDLIISDIDLKRSELDGIDLAHQFNAIEKVPIIFLTGIGGKETIDRAKIVNPAYYLVKPYNLTQLNVSIDFAIENFINKNKAEVNHSLQFHNPPTGVLHSQEDFFFAKKDNKRYIKVDIAKILWVEAMGSTVRIYTENDNFVFSFKLIRFEERVLHPSIIRIHKSYIVNLNKIIAYEYNKVVIRHEGVNKEFPIGQTYKKAFQNLIPRLMSE